MTDMQISPIEGMPMMTVAQAVERYNVLVTFVQTVMKRDKDFGVIPGTGTKPTLLKPGAEKLCTLFGFAAKFSLTDKIMQWGDDGSEPLFAFTYKCTLTRHGLEVAEGEGSCNSREKKYRWHSGERVCPTCGKPAIIKGKAEYGGGWLCFAKKGGCGAKFKAGDPAIESQSVGKVANPDIADVINTLQKMAQKRALVAAVLIGANASEFFTQDIEDMGTIEGQFRDTLVDVGPDFDAPKQPASETVKVLGPSEKLWNRWYTLTAEAKLAGVDFTDLDNDVSSETLVQRGRELRAAIEAKKTQVPA